MNRIIAHDPLGIYIRISKDMKTNPENIQK